VTTVFFPQTSPCSTVTTADNFFPDVFTLPRAESLRQQPFGELRHLFPFFPGSCLHRILAIAEGFRRRA
jgi:hypothetical protein